MTIKHLTTLTSPQVLHHQSLITALHSTAFPSPSLTPPLTQQPPSPRYPATLTYPSATMKLLCIGTGLVLGQVTRLSSNKPLCAIVAWPVVCERPPSTRTGRWERPQSTRTPVEKAPIARAAPVAPSWVASQQPRVASPAHSVGSFATRRLRRPYKAHTSVPQWHRTTDARHYQYIDCVLRNANLRNEYYF